MQDQTPVYEQALLDQQLQQQDNDPNALYADHMREEKVTNILQQIDPEGLLTEIEHRIRGEKKDIYTQEWVPINIHAKPVSEEMIANFISFLGAILNQNTCLSNFSQQEINNLMEVIIEWVRDDLSDNDEKYGIVGDYTEMTRIGNIICVTCLTVLKRSLNGQESRRVFKMMKVTESLTPPKKKGIMDMFKFG